MKTYKIDSEKATSLRKQLLYSYLAVIGTAILAAIVAATTGAGNGAFFLLAALVGTQVWHFVAAVRAVWNLWEWPGIAFYIVAQVMVGLLGIATVFLGAIANIAFLVYVYIQLGKQSEEVIKLPKREVFSE